MKSPKESEIRTGYQEAYRVYAEIIKPNSKVAVIGPSRSIIFDPSLAYTLTLLTDQGMAYVVDPKSSRQAKANSFEAIFEDIINNAAGEGDFKNHENELKALLGDDVIKRYKWMGRGDRAQHMPSVADQSIDAVVDHLTGLFIVNKLVKEGVYQSGSPKDEVLGLILGEYARILKPGGRLIFQTSHSMIGLTGNSDTGSEYLLDAFYRAGYKGASYQKVEDIFMLPVVNLSYSRMKLYPQLVAQLKFNVREDNIIAIQPVYKCPDLYIAER